MDINQKVPPLNVLLADDDIDDRFFFSKALSEIGIATNLVTVPNGEELMSYLAASLLLPDVLFLDLSMPRKTGFECLAEIKEQELLKPLPVIMFTTSYTRGIDFEENLTSTLLRMGALDYIRKPGDFEKLKQVIEQALFKMSEKKKLNH